MRSVRMQSLVVALVALPLVAASCPPTKPCAFTAPVARGVPPALPVAPTASESHVDIELARLYLRARIEALVATPDADECGTQTKTGVFVRDVKLEEVVEAGVKLNLLTIRLEPWMRGQSGVPVGLQQSYRLRLRLVPSMVSAATVPDQARRRALLCSPDPACTQAQLCSQATRCVQDCRAAACDATQCEGMCQWSRVPALACQPDPACNTQEALLLAFALHDLTSLGSGNLVAGADGRCTAACNVLDQQIVGALSDALAKTAPMTLPIAPISDMIRSITGASPQVTGVAVGSDADLKIGLRFDQPGALPFDSSTFATHLPRGDWAVRLSTALIDQKLDELVTSAITDKVGPIAVVSHPVSVTYVPGELRVAASFSIANCPNFRMTVKPIIKSSMCSAAGSSTLRMCQDPKDPARVDGSVGTGGLCAAWETVKLSFRGGWAVARVGPASGNSDCQVNQAIQFPAGAWCKVGGALVRDDFYATGIDTDGTILIVGRSAAMDQCTGRAPQRPAACP